MAAMISPKVRQALQQFQRDAMIPHHLSTIVNNTATLQAKTPQGQRCPGIPTNKHPRCPKLPRDDIKVVIHLCEGMNVARGSVVTLRDSVLHAAGLEPAEATEDLLGINHEQNIIVLGHRMDDCPYSERSYCSTFGLANPMDERTTPWATNATRSATGLRLFSNSVSGGNSKPLVSLRKDADGTTPLLSPGCPTTGLPQAQLQQATTVYQRSDELALKRKSVARRTAPLYSRIGRASDELRRERHRSSPQVQRDDEREGNIPGIQPCASFAQLHRGHAACSLCSYPFREDLHDLQQRGGTRHSSP
ncbi:hypothetical protein HPB48_007582 [Haemaphysalis longicornis]|uniref:Uncharacterized protein n=1 Tax=Haemaphysalis longicornis TaxID=44386 RepID=A0A9J6FMV3_HAELO|nr:hypothetical protein HPB48_007582 [Haemaphysalis longicornis]